MPARQLQRLNQRRGAVLDALSLLCLTALPLLAAALSACNGRSGEGAVAQGHWVGTWSTSPLCYGAATLLGLPATTRFADQSVRMIVHTSLGGEKLRVKLTNQCGDAPLAIGAAAVAMQDAGAGVREETSRPLTFIGRSEIDIPAGATATSDPVELSLRPLSDLTITLYFPDSILPTTSHPQAATGYVSDRGDFTAASDGAAFPTSIRQWVFLDAVEVLAPSDSGAVVAFGDSIIDGAGTSYDANTRWPDFLARRLIAASKNLGVLNQGINANTVLNGSAIGPSALDRFDQDALAQAGIKYVIFLEGINDIGLGSPGVTADQVLAGYREIVARSHARGIQIYGGTLTPAPFYKAYDEGKRQAVNHVIRQGEIFDAVIDFDAAVRDPADPTHWRRGLSDDALHPSDAGAAVLAEAIDLSLFP